MKYSVARRVMIIGSIALIASFVSFLAISIKTVPLETAYANLITPQPPGSQPPPNPAPSQTPSGITLQFPNPLNVGGKGCNTILCVFNKVTDIMLTLAIPLVAIMVMWGAFQIITAGGSPEKFTTGLKTIEYAAIGFAVILVAGAVPDIIQSIFT